jgi:hypothetical protein
MIRRDYILRMIEEFFEAMSRINALKKGQHWQEAAGELDGEFQRLIGAGAPAVARLTETELLSRIIQGEPTHVVHQKTLMLTTLLKEAGDVAVGQDRPEEGRSCYLKGLHLLLESLARTDVSEWPEFVPNPTFDTGRIIWDAPLDLLDFRRVCSERSSLHSPLWDLHFDGA